MKLSRSEYKVYIVEILKTFQESLLDIHGKLCSIEDLLESKVKDNVIHCITLLDDNNDKTT